MQIAGQLPQKSHLLEYGESLRNELDQFTKSRVRHQISLTYSPGQDMVVCEVVAKQTSRPFDVQVNGVDEHLSAALSNLNHKLKQQFSLTHYPET